MTSPQEIIYLDSNATTQLDPAVLAEMMPFLTDFYGNPSSGYRFGAQTKAAIDLARERVAALLGCEPGEIVFTSCGTESNNAALTSALQLAPDHQHIVTTAVEHSAIVKHGEMLAKRGCEVTLLGVDEEGNLDLGKLERSIRPDTALVSVMWANNETGVLFPIEEIAEIVRAKGVPFHTDAVQAVGKLPINLAKTKINFLALSGHKLHCPKGVGALYVNRRSRFRPFLIGGNQEDGRRGGTENVASIVALGKAAELAGAAMHDEQTRVRALRDRFEDTLLAKISGTQINGNIRERLPNTSNVSFEGIEAEGALMLLDQQNVCASSGSACTTGSLHASHVLRAMHFSDERARGSLRFSFSRFNTDADVDRALEIVPRVVAKLRSLTPRAAAAKEPALA